MISNGTGALYGTKSIAPGGRSSGCGSVSSSTASGCSGVPSGDISTSMSTVPNAWTLPSLRSSIGRSSTNGSPATSDGGNGGTLNCGTRSMLGSMTSSTWGVVATLLSLSGSARTNPESTSPISW